MRDTGSMLQENFSDLSFDEWLETINTYEDENCTVDFLGPDHAAIMHEGGKNLIVHFENHLDINANWREGRPLGWQLASEEEWSSLSLISRERSWFRDPYVYAYFDRLIDDGILDNFEKVVFYGKDAAAYAAAAYSVSAPMCRVLLISPQATLDPARAGWDNRFVKQRRQDFTSRFGYAPDMLASAEAATIICDPKVKEEAMHVSLFHAENTKIYRMPFLSGHIEKIFLSQNLFKDVILRINNGENATKGFVDLLRRRRKYLHYYRVLLSVTDSMQRPYLSKLVCRAALKVFRRPLFRTRLSELETL